TLRRQSLRRNIGQPRTLLPLSRSWFKGTLLEAHWPYRRGQVNLSPVMDLYNGEIIAWHSATRASFDLISSMLKKAFSRLTRGERPLLHSDQGWQYQMPAYRRLLDQRAVQQSMSRKGNCLDNAAMESFFGTLKAEFFHLNEFDSVEQLRAGIRQYIRYYNHERIRLKLKALSPVQYRTQPLLA
ncbi:IS3 family transposase, partial [Burkholderia mallei]|uniref:IS3 family transposase n=2 Tax=Burkholderia mallei TaxID=13373 RepID=UPI00203F221F